MVIAVLSDIHANRAAFEAVLEDAALRAVQRFVILGDIVGYGPDPEWCLGRVMAMVEGGAICLRGNHDSAISAPENLNSVARAAIDWTRPRLSAAQRDFLTGLPLTWHEDEVLFVHASAHSPGDWIYVTGTGPAMASFRVSDARLILCGHVHRPALYSCDLRGRVQGHAPRIGVAQPLIGSRRWLGVIGSVGQPRDGVAQAGYALLSPDAGELTWRRVPYDAADTAARIRAAGLPEALAQRVTRGI